MTVTQDDSGLVRTHDEALTVLVWAVPGARVQLHDVRPGPGSERARRYTVTLERLGHYELTQADVYALPMNALALAAQAKRVADAAARAAGE